MANVIATSAFLCQVDEDKCIACRECVERCSFDALTVDLTAQVNVIRCAGCGVCVLACPQEALSLLRRPEAEVLAPPATEEDWRTARANARGLDLDRVR
jgi:heterodisulfide reductase subunit A-like polyferredoxin